MECLRVETDSVLGFGARSTQWLWQEWGTQEWPPTQYGIYVRGCLSPGTCRSLKPLNPTPETQHSRHRRRFKNNCFAALRSSSKEGSYLRLVDFCITQLEAESNKEAEKDPGDVGEGELLLLDPLRVPVSATLFQPHYICSHIHIKRWNER